MQMFLDFLHGVPATPGVLNTLMDTWKEAHFSHGKRAHGGLRDWAIEIDPCREKRRRGEFRSTFHTRQVSSATAGRISGKWRISKQRAVQDSFISLWVNYTRVFRVPARAVRP